MKKLKDILLNPLKTTFYLSTAIGISSLISTGFILIWGNDGLNWLIYFPLTKGFLHADFEHFYYNIIIIFFLLLFPINRNYDFKKLFWLTLERNFSKLGFQTLIISSGIITPRLVISVQPSRVSSTKRPTKPLFINSS